MSKLPIQKKLLISDLLVKEVPIREIAKIAGVSVRDVKNIQTIDREHIIYLKTKIIEIHRSEIERSYLEKIKELITYASNAYGELKNRQLEELTTKELHDIYMEGLKALRELINVNPWKDKSHDNAATEGVKLQVILQDPATIEKMNKG